ncbi:PilN domain-containing protein [Clostridium sp. Cult3]|uniref:PilN domain-containing protein n=1 Tax=Clostridium sp. Cult3 TaxID=2079004 RepID=UPI001F30CDFF|nr:PilN domain-containing protein [Clostridium sp. Cult3]MCF6460073.1 hypothetical protein [Clostridium sp. Cult3]
MKDLNFFEPYIEKKEINIDKRLVFSLLGLLLTICILSYTILNQIRIRRIERDVGKLKATVEDERINKRVKGIENKKKEVAEFKQSLDKIKLIDDLVKEESFIDVYLLESITSSMPEDVFFTSISIYDDSIQIVGVSKNKYSIAELGKSLEVIEEFKEIFVENISSEVGYYNFNLNIDLKDVNIDEDEPAIEQDEDEETSDEE